MIGSSFEQEIRQEIPVFDNELMDEGRQFYMQSF